MPLSSDWQSPIAPGLSWYQASLPERPDYPPLDGAMTADVAIIGGGFTGLQAAAALAKAGVSVVLVEAARFGDGASGRNGGQIGTGQRWWPDEMEAKLGYAVSRALFDMAEAAKAHLHAFAAEHAIEIDYLPGQLNVAHKPGHADEYRKTVEILATRYDYPHMHMMDRAETEARVGSKRFHYGIHDGGTGHLHPLKLLAGVARVAATAGARLCEMTPATAIRSAGGKVTVDTARGSITADRALIATNAYINGLEPVTAAHVMPIRSFIGATAPLDDHPEIIPGRESIADSRFVVRYFRKTRDNRLLFGGREAYTADNPADMIAPIRRQIAEIYPQLETVPITHAWGGSVGITLPRQPFVREVMPGVTSIGGYSGHGVMLANYCGKLYADEITGAPSGLDHLRDLKVPAFPGGARFRAPLMFLAMTWYAMLDRL